MADGAVIWNCLQTVKARVVRRSFGAKTRVPYDAMDPSHKERALIRGPEGLICVGNVWDPILAKVWLLSLVARLLDSLTVCRELQCTMTWCSRTAGHIYLQLMRKKISQCLRSIYIPIMAHQRTSPSCVPQTVGNSSQRSEAGCNLILFLS